MLAVKAVCIYIYMYKFWRKRGFFSVFLVHAQERYPQTTTHPGRIPPVPPRKKKKRKGVLPMMGNILQWGVTEFTELPSDVGRLIVLAPHKLQVRLADQWMKPT